MDGEDQEQVPSVKVSGIGPFGERKSSTPSADGSQSSSGHLVVWWDGGCFRP